MGEPIDLSPEDHPMRKSLTTLLCLTLTASTTTLLACSIPVFRYAVEHWNPDLFTLTVYHNGEPTEAQQALLNRLQPDDLDETFVGNLQVGTIDVTSTEVELPEADWLAEVKPGVAWLVAHTPAKKGPPSQVFSDEFTVDNVNLLLESPQRKIVTDRLLQGDSAVWVLLECGDKEKDDAAAKTLTDELARMQATLKLPEIEEKDLEDGLLSLDPSELKIRFSLVRIPKDDPAEQAFISMLRTTEPDLNEAEIVAQPTALPVFGRGRSLWALVGAGIAADTIEDTCRFLTGGCQCTVKVQNPGVDMLTTVDWNLLVGAAPNSLQLERESPTGPPEYVSIAPGTAGEAASRNDVDEHGASAAAVDRSEGAPVTWLFGLGGFAVLVAGVSLTAVRRGS